MSIKQALIMAAGEARRMRPLTDNLPKPLLRIGDKALLGHIIDRLLENGVRHIIINGYHAIEPLRAYIDEIRAIHLHCRFTLSEENDLLETGGGAVKALEYLDHDAPFYMINGDAFWIDDGREQTLEALTKAWEKAEDCDLILLLQPVSKMHLGGAVGDYHIDGDRAIRTKNHDGSNMFTGIRICTPSILMPYKVEKFSFLTIMDDMEAKGRLAAAIHKGQWYHISTPQDLNNVQTAFFKGGIS